MPIIQATILEGYTPEAKARLGRALTGAVRQVMPALPEAITVILSETPGANYMRGGQSRQGAAPFPDPVDTVKGFLAAMEARDLATAATYLAPGFTMQFPAAPEISELSELVAWAKPRYRAVTKTYAQFDLSTGPAGPVVYCNGTLAGEWPDGTPFNGIRFIDRFELGVDGLLRQDVWNDMGEHRP